MKWEERKRFWPVSACCVYWFLNVLIVCHRGSVGGNYELHLTMNSDKEQEIQVYYSAAGELSEKSSQVKTYDQVGESQELVFSVPFQFNMVRLDLGTQPGTFTIENVYLGCKDTKTEIPEMTNPKLIEGQQLESLEANDGNIKNLDEWNRSLCVAASG